MGGSSDEKIFSLTNEAKTTALTLIDQKRTSDSLIELIEKISDIDKRVSIVETEQKNFTEHFATKTSLEKQKSHLIYACITAAVVVAGLVAKVFL